MDIDSTRLEKSEWKVIGNSRPIIKRRKLLAYIRSTIPNKTYSSSIFVKLAEAYHGLQPWNVQYNENLFDSLLVPGEKRPNSARILGPQERFLYRKEKGWEN